MILDLSFPFGHSVNDGINKDDFTVTYSKVSDAIALIIKAGRGALLMSKVDIKSAYRIIPVHPSDLHLLEMFWRDCYYIDLTLPFGLRSAPAIFDTVADSFHWCVVNNWNVPDLLHYLDDYFTLGPPNCLVFLGIELDSIRMTARLPADKHAELITLLDEWANKRWCKPLQSLIGKLSHACTVVLKRLSTSRNGLKYEVFYQYTLLGYLRCRINENSLKFKCFKPRGVRILKHIKNGLRTKFKGLKVILSW